MNTNPTTPGAGSASGTEVPPSQDEYERAIARENENMTQAMQEVTRQRVLHLSVKVERLEAENARLRALTGEPAHAE